MTKSKRTRIVATAENACDLMVWDPRAQRYETRSFFAPFPAPGRASYIRDETGAQVCAGLASRGITMEWDGRQPLVETIRREWREVRREIAQEQARWGC